MKRFYNNTLISGAFSKALRVLALLCVLLGFSSSAWGDTYYIDASCISGVQQISWLQYQNGGGGGSGDIVSQNTNFNGKTAFQFTADAGETLKLQLKIVSGNTTIYPQLYNINLSGSNNCIELSLDGSTLSYKAKQGSTLKCAGGCTPSATITGASYNGSSIELSGSMTETCGKKCYYGWQWNTDGVTWIYDNHIGGSTGTYNSTSPVSNYSNTWAGPSGGLVPGTTYYFRAYAYVDETFYSDNNTRSVTIPSSGGDGGGDGGADCSGVVYLKPNDNWKSAGAYFAVYMWNGSGNYWIRMTESICPGLYKAIIPEEYQDFKFVRMNPNGSDSGNNYLNWENDWNETGNLTLQQDKNCFNISDWGTGNWTTTDCTDGCNIIAEATNVLIARDALVNKQAKTATMYGYLKKTDCFPITKRGFYYCSVNDGAVPCTPTEASDHVDIEDEALERGEEFNATLSNVVDGKTYYYRAYAEIDGKIQLSQETRSFATDPCIPQECCGSKAIVYSINAAFTQDNECKLQFRNLQDAINHLKETADRDDDYAYVTNKSGSYNLQQPVVMNVVYYDDTPENPASAYIYRGTTDVGVYAGDNKPANANLIQDFNKSANADPANTLTIKAGTKVAKPWIHHLVIRNSRNIVLDSLCIYSDPNKVGDNALEIDVNSIGWDGMTTGQFADANIVIQNCMIGSDGFTGVHVSAYDGITFKKNDFEIVFEGKTTDGNVLNWSASAKFMMCKNIKFIQNNFRGSQPTMLWLQECQNALFMNNVFWNTNTFVPAEGSKAVVPSAVRLVSQYANEIDNIGFYYNTFYFANNDINAPWGKYNFFNQYLAYTNNNQANINKYGSNIYFKYNNCYSYDKDCPGMYDVVGSATGGGADMTYTTVTATSDSENFCPNNFWSQYDQDKLDKGETVTKSAFAFGCSENDFVNVKGQVCETTATGPASLIVKGNDLNSGVKPDVDFTNIQLTDEEKYSDRYLQAVRPQDGEGWTFGAYQSKSAIPTTTIYWVGVTDKWDDRNNWEYETRDASGKMVRQRVSCINTLSEDLKVIIEEIGTVEVAGGRKWPKIPDSFDAEARTEATKDKPEDLGVPASEQVSAGLGKAGFTPTKFASTIELAYGAGLRGVENLKEADGKTLRYDRAITHFDAPRDRWLLVGTVVKPFVDEKAGTTRNVISRDYYMDFLPQIYMHKTEVDGNTVSWTRTFPDLNVEVKDTTVFAINASNYYGKYYESAATYNKWNGTNYDGTAPIPYTFTGRFAVEEGATGKTPYAFKATANATNLLNNNYPCNIDALEIERLELGTVNVYDYENASFVSTSKYKTEKETDNVFIKAQNGFVFTPAKGISSLSLTDDILAEGSTRTRSTQVQLPTFSLQVDNANTTAPGASNVVVVLDEAQPANYSSPLNTPKVFTRNEDTPEAYIVSGNENCSRLYVDGDTKRIPLGIRLQKAMNITFEKVYSIDFSKVILLDAKTGKEYNLLERNYTTEKLLVSENNKDIVNRFFLVLEQEEYLPDDDVVTDIEDVVEGADINVYAVNGNTIRVVSTGVDLQSIYVSDMAGRTMKYEANGNFVELQLPVAQGVYMVHVIGDNATKTEKVILK